MDHSAILNASPIGEIHKDLPTLKECRPLVQLMAVMMEKRLRDNAHKDGKPVSMASMVNGVQREVRKLLIFGLKKQSLYEMLLDAADVANMAAILVSMMSEKIPGPDRREV